MDDDGDSTIDRAESFVYDGDDVIFVFGDTSSLTNRYLHGDVVDQVFADETASEVLWALTDNQGTVRDIANYDPTLDESSVLNHREFDSFGKITSESNGSVEFAYAYTGRFFDEDTLVQNNRGRWYDPQVGRWLSEDPIGFAAGDANISRYVGNAPTNFTDPSGMDPPGGGPGGSETVDIKALGAAPSHTVGLRDNWTDDQWQAAEDQWNAVFAKRELNPRPYTSFFGGSVGSLTNLGMIGLPEFKPILPNDLPPPEGTIGFGGSVDLDLLFWHFQYDIALHVGYSQKHGLTAALASDVVAPGDAVGVGGGAGVGLEVTVTNAKSVHDLGNHDQLALQTPIGDVAYIHGPFAGNHWDGIEVEIGWGPELGVYYSDVQSKEIWDIW